MSEATIKRSDRSIAGLRDSLFETLDELRAGMIDANKAKAVMGVSQVILNSVDTQLRVEHYRNRSSALESLPNVSLTTPERISAEEKKLS